MTTPPKPPKRLFFTLFADPVDRRHVDIKLHGGTEFYRDANVIELLTPKGEPDANALVVFKKNLLAHVKQYGTLDELTLWGHGSNFSIGNWQEPRKGDVHIKFTDTLKVFEEIKQETGINPCKRLVFDGCETMKYLDSEDVYVFRDFAQKHGVDLVGTTSIEYARGIVDKPGVRTTKRAVMFGANGTISYDKTDTAGDPLIADDSPALWTQYYLDKTHNQAEQAVVGDVRKLANSYGELVKQAAGEPYVMGRLLHAGQGKALKEQIEAVDNLTGAVSCMITDKGTIIVQSDGTVHASGALRNKLHAASVTELDVHLGRFDGLVPQKLAFDSKEFPNSVSVDFFNFSYSEKAVGVILDKRSARGNLQILLAGANGGYMVVEAGQPTEKMPPIVNRAGNGATVVAQLQAIAEQVYGISCDAGGAKDHAVDGVMNAQTHAAIDALYEKCRKIPKPISGKDPSPNYNALLDALTKYSDVKNSFGTNPASGCLSAAIEIVNPPSTQAGSAPRGLAAATDKGVHGKR